MKNFQILSALGSAVAAVSVFLPWISINLMIFGTLQPSLYDLITNYSPVMGQTFSNEMTVTLLMVIVTVVLGVLGAFLRKAAGWAVATAAFAVIFFFLALVELRNALPSGYGSFFFNVNMGPVLLILAGALFFGAVLVKDRPLAIVAAGEPAAVVIAKEEKTITAEEEWVFCSNCGYKNPVSATFCYKCGKPLFKGKA